MNTQQTQTPTAAEIRQAVAFGRQCAVREILDLLAKEKPQGGWSIADDVSSMVWQPPSPTLLKGYQKAVAVVRGYRIEGEPKR